ncbi:MAG TPA: hypothetical protein DCS07_09945 [Bdellovibrionales bacterium]|nr:MAG: hypothetical protein A2Z97_04385 [Bdellovibrionales bacterium GWB1_52_6]OFZ02718.1 MAG: hypothetical protein A2X97_12305 [Bdellovibrionales bacterium GWA1_52_35]OFZ39752.1 MAG: hypothetical protein A2070_00995 [Bdellovibrionales bacterium GWC1_52_8]HAR42934.1 hypothetical protein [Bdellovibrionales bacterium]HCM41616.1 hypothetical protein [Bdellovibrionales bacterium]
MLGFAAWAGWRWVQFGLLFFALTALRDVAATWFLLTRRPDISGHRFCTADLLAYISCAMPLLYVPGPDHGKLFFFASNVLAISGFGLATTALFELGVSFGISPAYRGTVESGVYRYTRHPMYTGYAIAEASFILSNPYNIWIYAISMLLYRLRALSENSILKQT